ncbi:MAG: rsh 1 [Acidobacteria bacterium]|jgi:guanosine-3',5'-bis(diphosphate) 3'-pyrophosphohydrolase|nr:rsh 1 [Acidobacteriota bacterium]
MNNTKTLIRAINFAAQKHRDQKRKGADTQPYINHPLEVLNYLTDIGNVEDYDVLTAAALHDTVEDTETSKEEIAEKFGKEVAEMVLEVTDDKKLPKDVRKQLQIEHAPHLSKGAKLIKLGDKISNITDVMNNPPAGWSIERRLEYIEWGTKVVDGLRGTNAKLEKHFDDLIEKAKAEIQLRNR